MGYPHDIKGEGKNDNVKNHQASEDLEISESHLEVQFPSSILSFHFLQGTLNWNSFSPVPCATSMIQ